MVKRKALRATAVLLTLAFLCFTAGQSVEIAHPIEESATHHEHWDETQSSSAVLFCDESHEHSHHCLHQQSLVPNIGPPQLTPDWTCRVNTSLPRVPAAFVLVLDLRPRAPPALPTI